MSYFNFTSQFLKVSISKFSRFCRSKTLPRFHLQSWTLVVACRFEHCRLHSCSWCYSLWWHSSSIEFPACMKNETQDPVEPVMREDLVEPVVRVPQPPPYPPPLRPASPDHPPPGWPDNQIRDRSRSPRRP